VSFLYDEYSVHHAIRELACYGLIMLKLQASETPRSTGDRSPAERRIHLVDVENLVGSSATSAAAVAEVRRHYAAVAPLLPEDQVVLAKGPTAAAAAWFGWGPARRLVRAGLDGADRALLEVIRVESLAGRYGRVILASGDGIFAEACARLQSEGCAVTVVARPGALSRALRFAVWDVRFLPLLGQATLVQFPRPAA
jgi:hypothetical protein